MTSFYLKEEDGQAKGCIYSGDSVQGYTAIKALALGKSLNLHTDTYYPSMDDAIDIKPMVRKKLFTPNAPQAYEGNSIRAYLLKDYQRKGLPYYSPVVYSSYEAYKEALSINTCLVGYVTYLPGDKLLELEDHARVYRANYWNASLADKGRTFCGIIVDYTSQEARKMLKTGHTFLADLINVDLVKHTAKVGRFRKVCRLKYYQASELISDLNSLLVYNRKSANVGLYNSFILDFTAIVHTIIPNTNKESFTYEELFEVKNSIDKIVEVFRSYIDILYSGADVSIGITINDYGIKDLGTVIGLLTRAPDFFYCSRPEYSILDTVYNGTMTLSRTKDLRVVSGLGSYSEAVEMSLVSNKLTLK